MSSGTQICKFLLNSSFRAKTETDTKGTHTREQMNDIKVIDVKATLENLLIELHG